MNILLISSADGWGGAERLFCELGEGLVAAGNVVCFVCRPKSQLADRLSRSVEIVTARCGGELDLATLAKLLALIRQRRVEVIVCNERRDCWLGGLAGRLLGVPAVRVKGMMGTRTRLRERIIHRQLLAKVVCVSDAVAASLAPLQLPPERLAVIFNGIDVPQLTEQRSVLRQRLGIVDGDFAVGFVGRLVPEKGVDLLPGLMQRLVDRNLPARILVAGEGRLRSQLQAEIQGKAWEKRLHILGFQPDPHPVFAAADVAVVPSRVEPFGLVAIEAWALGTPLVASGVDGLAEICRHEENALVVQPDDMDGLTEAICRLHSSVPLSAQLRAAGLLSARRYSRTAMIGRYTAMFDELTAQG